MNIVIPTRGRVGNQLTLQNLSPALRKYTTLVCPEEEVSRHRYSLVNISCEDVRIVAQPSEITGIARKRRWILENLAGDGGRVIMLDDDLKFRVYHLKEGLKISLPAATSEQKNQYFAELWEKITPDVPHAGFAPLQNTGRGTNKTPPSWKVGRMLCVLGYHAPTVLRHAELGRLETKEDMDVTLQLLRAGFPNAVTDAFAAGQSWGNTGGCSIWRTVESSNADSLKLAELHPGYVRVTEKIYGGVRRLEVQVSWQKALRDGMSRRAA